jgi:2-methylcitrate dehydratase PrpD
MSVSEKLFSFVCDTHYRQLPKEAINKAKHCFLDGLGVMVAGSIHPASNIVLDYARAVGGKTEAGGRP